MSIRQRMNQLLEAWRPQGQDFSFIYDIGSVDDDYPSGLPDSGYVQLPRWADVKGRIEDLKKRGASESDIAELLKLAKELSETRLGIKAAQKKVTSLRSDLEKKATAVLKGLASSKATSFKKGDWVWSKKWRVGGYVADVDVDQIKVTITPKTDKGAFHVADDFVKITPISIEDGDKVQHRDTGEAAIVTDVDSGTGLVTVLWKKTKKTSEIAPAALVKG